MTDQRSQPDALPDADADDTAIEQTGTSGSTNAATDVEDLGMEKDGPNDAGVTASGAE